MIVHHTFSFSNFKILEQFQAVVPLGKRSVTIENLIRQFLEEKKNSEGMGLTSESMTSRSGKERRDIVK